MVHVEWCGFANRSGYAQAAQDYIYAMRRHTNYDIKISLLHSNPEQLSMTPERYQEYMAMMNKNRVPGAPHILHCIPDMQRRIPVSGKTVGFATFETFEPPQNWAEILNGNDAVICPSQFNVKIFEKLGVKKPIHYIPHCVDTNLYHPGVKVDKNERFTFLFFGTWMKRKGYCQLLEAWMKEFDSNDNVRLLIKTNRYTMANKAIAELKQLLGLQKKELAPIVFESRVLNEQELPLLFKSADCLISPTLGEGFGLPGLQCMALGVPVAITNFSGCTDYANDKTATLIEPSGFIVYNEMDGHPQFQNHKWAHITVDSVRQIMRNIYENPQTLTAKIDAGLEMVRKFSYAETAKRFEILLESL